MNRPPNARAARFHDDDKAGKRTRQLNAAAVAPQARPAALAALIRRLLVLASLAGALSAAVSLWLAGWRP